MRGAFLIAAMLVTGALAGCGQGQDVAQLDAWLRTYRREIAT